MKIVLAFVILAFSAGGVSSSHAILAQETGQDESKVERPEGTAQQQHAIKRLILKDGSYQLISQYEVNGKIVRYFSTERHEWEEIPYSLVDWPATKQFESEAASARETRNTQSAEAAARERAELEALTPLVAPGIRLPDSSGVFLLETYQGQPELNELRQNGANVNRNTAGNILRGVINPVASTKQTIELAGPHARVQSHVAEPAIYVALESRDDPEINYTPETAKEHLRIVRCEAKKGNRIIGAIKIAVYGKVKQQASYVETRVEPVAGNWVKVTPATPLSAGEYALVELLGKRGINTAVWDFGVNTSAPRNTRARKAEPVRPDEAPVLQKRPRPVKSE
jgi:hypothetical protein